MSSAVSRPPPSPSSSLLMLPYGYQIDLDFIKYCENLTHPNLSDAELQRRQRRRQRQSMEVMLGIQMEMQNQMDELHDFWERKPPEPPPRTHHHHIESPIVPFYMKQQKRQPNMSSWDPSLNDVVDDFEKTLERSNSKREKGRRSLPAPNAKGYMNFEIGEFETLVNIFPSADNIYNTSNKCKTARQLSNVFVDSQQTQNHFECRRTRNTKVIERKNKSVWP